MKHLYSWLRWLSDFQIIGSRTAGPLQLNLICLVKWFWPLYELLNILYTDDFDDKNFSLEDNIDAARNFRLLLLGK